MVSWRATSLALSAPAELKINRGQTLALQDASTMLPYPILLAFLQTQIWLQFKGTNHHFELIMEFLTEP